MGKKVREYKSGDFIFAKVKGYPAWPARVQKQNGKKYFVYFYGTGETANLPPNMIFDYAENKDKFLNKSVKRKDFNDGVKQIEHDFANNVPLEQVIGALADAEPAPADDTMNESANDTADDSAIADATADETMDENAANSTGVSDGPVEDSDETGALVIDEGKQKGRKSTTKAAATPKAPKEPKTPRGRPKKEEAAPSAEEEEKKDDEIVSRSGRKIRPKRYIDEQTEENSTLPSPAPKKRRGASLSVEKEKADPKEKPQDKNIRAYNTVQQSELRELKEPFKSADSEKENILITYLPSGEYCGVKLFTSRPTSFKNDASRLQWDKQAASNAITLKRQLEKGQITPESISGQLVMNLNLTDEEKATLDKDRDLEMKKSRLHFLKTEMKLIELDAKIKTCISLEKADTELCLKLIDEILELDLAALMLLKHPTCMETVKRMRVYVGNTPSWEMSEGEALTFSKQAHRIRNKADALFITMRDLFDVPTGLGFPEYFHERVAQFKAATEHLHADKLLEMVHEPIELTQPASHSMKTAIEAANEEEPMETDETPQKKKATPVKGKKASGTPSKTPLKRQSSRKLQQEEKDKEKQKEKENEKEKEMEKEKEIEKENQTEKEVEKPTDDTSEEPDVDKPNDTEKTNSTETSIETNENNDQSEKLNDEDKPNENDIDEADNEEVNENSDKKDDEETETEDKGAGDSEKVKDSPKEKESNTKEKGDKAEKSEDTQEEEDEKQSEEKDNKSSKDSKKGKESDKNSNADKNSKSKEHKKDDKPKDDAKSSKDGRGTKAGDKRKDRNKEDKEKSEEKEKVDFDEPRAKRSSSSKKTEPPPRSPAKRKSKS